MIYLKILIHASLDLVQDMLDAKSILEKNAAISVVLPELTRYQHIRDELGDDITFTKIKHRLTCENVRNVEQCDALFIINREHRGVDNYIGGNSFLEMIIAFYLKKPILLLNDIPESMTYTEEIKSLYPLVVGSYNAIFDYLDKISDASCTHQQTLL
jgi:hypothetical protein